MFLVNRYKYNFSVEHTNKHSTGQIQENLMQPSSQKIMDRRTIHNLKKKSLLIHNNNNNAFK